MGKLTTKYDKSTDVEAALDKGVEALAKTTELKEDLSELTEGADKSFIAHYDDTFTGNIAGSSYKSSTIEIPANYRITKIKFYSKNAAPSVQGYLFILNSNNEIIDKIDFTPSIIGWNEMEINKTYSVTTYIALSGGTIGLTYSSSEKANYYSNGLFEGASTERNKSIGDTMVFAHNVEGRYYEFGFEVYIHKDGLDDILKETSESIKEITGIMPLNVFSMPKTTRISEEGYSLFGRWYNFSDTYKCCVSSAGASIMLKCVGSTNVSIDIEQVVHPSHSDWRMETEPFIAYSIDGSTFTRVQIGTNPINVSIPSVDEHFLWIVVDGLCLNSGSANRNSGWSAVNLKSITTDGKIYKIKPKSKQVLFVGDSMIEGIDTLGTDSKSASNSTVNEFSFKTARELNSIPLIQGYGGSTTWSGVKYEKYSVVDTMARRFIVDNEVDLIVCEYGHNDYTLVNSGTKTEQEFISEYNSLIDLLKNHYTGVPIIIIVPFSQRLRNAVETVANGRDYCYLIETDSYDYQTLDGTHPSSESATSIAKSLASDIIKIVGETFFRN